MKTRIIFILASLLIGIACSKNDDESGNNPDKPNKPTPLPDLPDPDDVCSCMDDLIFMQYCYDKFDVNKDGKVSKIEAAAVVNINLDHLDVRKLTGIGYFTNLESLSCYNCGQLISADLSNNTKITLNNAFSGCRSLVEINLPEGITSIGGWAFYNCSSLTNIVIPENVTLIGDYAFYNCSSLTNIVIPENVTSIGDWAFYNCSSLTNIVIPENVTLIGDQAFYNCSSLTSIYCKPTTPPILSYELGPWGFVLYVPAESIEAYKNSQWSRYYSSIEAIK